MFFEDFFGGMPGGHGHSPGGGDVDTENASYGDDDDGLCIIVRVIRAYVFFAGARLLVRPLKPHHQGSWSHEGGLVSGPKITIFACSQPCLLDSHL